jgi:hypothetical protein
MVDESPRIVRDMRAIADYVQHRSIQRIVLRKLERQRELPVADLPADT